MSRTAMEHMERGTVVAAIFFVAFISDLTLGKEKEVDDRLHVNVPVNEKSSETYSGQRGTTVFYDDFSSGVIDPKKWTHDITNIGLGFDIWSPESRNSYVKNNTLYIKPTLTADRFGEDIFYNGTIDARQVWGGCHVCYGGGSCLTQGRQNRPVMSASLWTSGHIKYGRVEVVAQLPKGDWLWPAIWLMPVESLYGGWPKSGEFDIMEAAGNLNLTMANGTSVGADHMGSNVHFGTARNGSQHIRNPFNYRLEGTTFGDEFHTYWLDWTEDYIRTGVDDHRVLTLDTPPQGFWNASHLNGTNIWARGGKNAPFDRPFYLILNVAIGGNWFAPSYINYPYKQPWTTGASDDYFQFWEGRDHWLPTWHGEDIAMKVKSVKMVQY
ncbi:beta-1,3-glucan-binding protein-like [Littorina saxatilis]|uniref:GH16 domain-containing protein n=1 Tax=Littorina saxatilis TaxID=31220 RepID=A0AAN9BB05_9CAEN